MNSFEDFKIGGLYVYGKNGKVLFRCISKDESGAPVLEGDLSGRLVKVGDPTGWREVSTPIVRYLVFDVSLGNDVEFHKSLDSANKSCQSWNKMGMGFFKVVELREIE